jgi:serine/threonine protein phosphatase PrpC
MAVNCPACGKISQDAEFCDHCNADLAPPPDRLPPRACLLPGGPVELDEARRQRLSRPDQAVLLADRGVPKRVRWLADLEPVQGALRERLALQSWVLPSGSLVPDGLGAWLIFETTRERYRPWETPVEDPLDETARLLSTIKPMVDALEELHRLGLAWLMFDPEEIEQGPAGRLGLTNLDLSVFPFGQCPERITVRPAFAAPEVVRFKPETIGPRTDVFHLAMYCWYWLAGLLPDGFPGNGLDSFQYEIPGLRIYQPHLLEGIETVLRQGLSLEAGQRFTGPAGLFAALQEAVERAYRRRRATGKIHWDIGTHTRTGRTKQALNRANEDHVMAQRFAEPDRALVAVADGISSCDVGSGALASMITMMVLENGLGSDMRAEHFPTAMQELCRRGAQMLIDWAMEKGYRDQLAQGSDLMGTTLTASWLEGRYLCLANLGDSRAYLIDGPVVEQLTVDGDLGSHLLRYGTPPEQLRELGLLSKALRECVGGCTLDGNGQVTVQDDACVPTITHWPLLPGDIIVLCTDGLVEESAFLEPEVMAELVRTHKHLPAQQIAERLADAADVLQRLPTFLEPEGFGDNISCVVIKILDAV